MLFSPCHLSAALIALSPEEVRARVLMYPQRKKIVAFVGLRTNVAWLRAWNQVMLEVMIFVHDFEVLQRVTHDSSMSVVFEVLALQKMFPNTSFLACGCPLFFPCISSPSPQSSTTTLWCWDDDVVLYKIWFRNVTEQRQPMTFLHILTHSKLLLRLCRHFE